MCMSTIWHDLDVTMYLSEKHWCSEISSTMSRSSYAKFNSLLTVSTWVAHGLHTSQAVAIVWIIIRNVPSSQSILQRELDKQTHMLAVQQPIYDMRSCQQIKGWRNSRFPYGQFIQFTIIILWFWNNIIYQIS